MTAAANKPIIGQRRIRVTTNGSRFTARVEKFYVSAWTRAYGPIKTLAAWNQCYADGKEATWTGRSSVKVYRKAVAYIEKQDRLDAEDRMVDAFRNVKAEYVEIR